MWCVLRTIVIDVSRLFGDIFGCSLHVAERNRFRLTCSTRLRVRNRLDVWSSRYNIIPLLLLQWLACIHSRMFLSFLSVAIGLFIYPFNDRFVCAGRKLGSVCATFQLGFLCSGFLNRFPPQPPFILAPFYCAGLYYLIYCTRGGIARIVRYFLASVLLFISRLLL